MIPFIAEKGKGGGKSKTLKVHWQDAGGKVRSGNPLEFLKWVTAQAQAKEGDDFLFRSFPPTADNEIFYLRLAELKVKGAEVWHLRKRPKREDLPKAMADQLAFIANQTPEEFIRYFPRDLYAFLTRKGMGYFEIAQRHLRIAGGHLIRPLEEAFAIGLLSRNARLDEIFGLIEEIEQKGRSLEDSVLKAAASAGRLTPYWRFLNEQPGIAGKTAARIIAAGPFKRFSRNGWEALAGLGPESSLKEGRKVDRTAFLFRAFLDWRRRLRQRPHEYNSKLSSQEAEKLAVALAAIPNSLPPAELRRQRARVLVQFRQWGKLYEEVDYPYYLEKHPGKVVLAEKVAAKATARRFARWMLKELKRIDAEIATAAGVVPVTDGD